MNVQIILVALLFLAALIYIGRLIYRSVTQSKSSCNTGCGKCSANFDEIPTPKN